MKAKTVADFIDPTIADPKLREFDWFVSLYTFTEQMDIVLAAKWRRAVYLQRG